MRVTDKMTIHEYEAWAQEYRPEKVPDLRSRDGRRHVGATRYDFAEDPPRMRRNSAQGSTIPQLVL